MRHAPIPPFSEKEKIRLWSKIESSNDESACWPWLAYKGSDGYGKFRRHKPRMQVRPARAVYAIIYGDPGDLIICHRCDNPACCNPSHLYLGTHADNMADMVRKGRSAKNDRKGIKNGRAKLNGKDIEQITRLLSQRRTNKEIGHYFGVTHSMISAIRLGKAWGMPPVTEKYASMKQPRLVGV